MAEKINALEEANILITALRLEVFSVLGKASLSASEVARKTRSKKEGIEVLLLALVSMGALRCKEGKFSNTPVTYKNLCKDSPHYKRGFVMLRQEDGDEWSQLYHTIKNGRNLADYEDDDDPEFRREFSYAMHERSSRFSGKIADIVARKPVGSILDLGGGPGSYSAAILKKDKNAKGTVLDRSSALSVAREIAKSLKLARRFKYIEGDIFETPLKCEYDTIYLSNVLHIYNPGENKSLFKKIYKALKPGGRFIIVDLFLKENRYEPYDPALFSITMLLYTATGKVYTFAETEKLLKQTGFINAQWFPLGEGSQLVEACKSPE